MSARGTEWPGAVPSSRERQRDTTTRRHADNAPSSRVPRAVSGAGTRAKDPGTPRNPRRARLLRILFDPAEIDSAFIPSERVSLSQESEG